MPQIQMKCVKVVLQDLRAIATYETENVQFKGMVILNLTEAQHPHLNDQVTVTWS